MLASTRSVLEVIMNQPVTCSEVSDRLDSDTKNIRHSLNLIVAKSWMSCVYLRTAQLKQTNKKTQTKAII